jgi:maleate cis-trans isomerase
VIASTGARAVTETVAVVKQLGLLAIVTVNVLTPVAKFETTADAAFVGVIVTPAGPLQV